MGVSYLVNFNLVDQQNEALSLDATVSLSCPSLERGLIEMRLYVQDVKTIAQHAGVRAVCQYVAGTELYCQRFPGNRFC